MKDQLQVSVVQSEILWNRVGENLAAIESLLADAEPSDLIVLPEMFATGFVADQLPPETETAHILDWMRNLAQRHSAAVAGSVTVSEGGFRYNRLFFVTPDGETGTYDKRHLFCRSLEPELYRAGDTLPIFEYAGWKICPQICYDLRFPVWCRNRFENGEYKYDLLLYVANWPEARVEVWNTLLAARAIENQCFVVGCNCVGVDTLGHRYSGASQIVGPTGRVMERAAASLAQVISSTLSLPKLTGFRSSFPVGNDWERLGCRL